MLGTPLDKAADIKAGDASVSTKTGALQYSYPLTVPPGRAGMAPQLALSYSSQGATYGGIASGWSLSIPLITEDTSAGRLKTRSPEVEWGQMLLQQDYAADDLFVSSLAGGDNLVRVIEPWPLPSDTYSAYRARHDGSYARYERMKVDQPFRWRVRTTDGSVMRFGDSSTTGQGTWDCSTKDPGIISDQYAPLTHTTDHFGNEIRYDYEQGASGECRIKQIVWGQNSGAGINGPFARVAFNWTLHTPPTGCTNTSGLHVGAQYSYRTGRLIVSGASKLLSISATAFPTNTPGSPQHTRQYALTYSSDSCGQRAPLRELLSIQESASGLDAPLVTLPAVQFSYNPASTIASTPISGPPGWNQGIHRSSNLSWGYRRTDDRWPSVEAMMLDVDGDGLLDRVYNPDAQVGQPMSNCRAAWERNPGGGAAWIYKGEIPLPRLKWRGAPNESQQSPNGATAAYRPTTGGQAPSDTYESCALNGQVTAYRNGDGNGPPGYCHTAPNASPISCTPGTFTCPGGTRCPLDSSGPANANYRTYLAYRWLDMDGDGLVDLVAAVHGKIDSYDIERGSTYLGNTTYAAGEQNGPRIPSVGEWPACPTQQDTCVDPGSSLADIHNCSSGTACTIRWDVLVSVVTGLPAKPCFSVLARAGGDGGGSYTPTRAPYARCGGLYPWLIYKNRGDGVFDNSPTIKYQPIPLESDTGDSAMSGPSMVSQHHAVMDFDGDGILDAVAHEKTSPSSNPNVIYVWLGDGTGGFSQKRYTFPTRPRGSTDLNALTGTGSVGTSIVESKLGLLDINADGLPDHWLSLSGSNNVAFHDGTQQRLTPNSGSPTGERFVPAKPGNDADYFNLFPSSGVTQTGTSKSRWRAIDVDSDGRVDIVDARDTQRRVYWNAGGQFLSSSQPYPHATGTSREGLSRRTEASYTGSPADVEPYTWELKTDLIDLDGNGVPESATFDASGFHRVLETSPAPQRLLSAINNGRGATTNISYAHMHDPLVVVQRPDLFWPDQYRKASPRTAWVVKSMATSGTHGIVQSTSNYHYQHPRFGPDEERRFAFRGFETVTTTSPSGSRTVETFAYAPDSTGRKVRSVAFSAEQPTTPATIARTTWELRSLFGGLVRTFHPTISESFTCSSGQSESACTTLPSTNANTGYTKTSSAFSALPAAPATAVIIAETETVLRSSAQDENGDRSTVGTHHILASTSAYLVRPLLTTKMHRVMGTMLTYSKTAKIWDSTSRLLLQDETWFDNIDANRAITKYEYDSSTGNIIGRWKPKQYAAGTTKTTYSYDSKKLLILSEVNELGHQRSYTYDYGTGAKLQTDGPNQRTCVTGPSCPLDATHPQFERAAMRVDGLGRPIEHWRTISSNGVLYDLVKTGTVSYVDASTSTTPMSVTTRQLISATSSVWTEQKTELDGLGRTIRNTTFTQGSTPSNQVTTSSYDSSGNIRLVTVPDPADPTQLGYVSYEYFYDSLNRPTSLRRPDHSGTSRSGIAVTYDGLEKTTTEIAGASGGVSAVTRTYSDSFGRVVSIDEKSSPISFSTTLYEYGPHDQVVTVTDPENGEVAIQYDFAGRRISVTRPAGRTWSYVYDRNNNLVAQTTPYPNSPDPLTAPKYTSTSEYDDLDRVKSKLIARRELSLADRRLFGTNLEVYQYDATLTGNEKGRLDIWAAYAPDPQEQIVGSNYDYDSQGNIRTSRSIFKTAGTFYSRGIMQTFNLFGSPSTTRHQDFVGGTNELTTTTNYDARGLPSSITVSGSPAITLAEQSRNTAGLVTKRRTNVAGATGFIESNWTYDKLGRVADQTVQSGIGQIARQTMAYHGGDDVASLTHVVGATSRTFAYGYDERHQVASVASSVPGYFSGSYQYSDSGRLTAATQNRSIIPAPSGGQPRLLRDVEYVYSTADKEQVNELRHASNGALFASYTYDLVGNQTGCAYPATNETLEYLYDGKDQLRRVTKRVSGTITGTEEYWYDERGQRRQSQKRNASGAKTELVWIHDGTQSHYDASMNITKVYSHLLLGTPVARYERTGNSTVSSELQFHGLASSLLAAVDLTGLVRAAYFYSPFGEVMESVDAGGGNGILQHQRRFNDKQVDDISGLAYYGARYYDSTLVGWTQPDPLYVRIPDLAKRASPRRGQTYIFSLNNPLRYTDPDGLSPRVTEAAGYALRVQNTVQDSDPKLTATTQLVREGISRAAQPGGALHSLVVEQFSKVLTVGYVRNAPISSSPHVSNILLVDLGDRSSKDKAGDVGGEPARRAIAGLSIDSREPARSTVGGNMVVISVDRIQASLEKAGAKDQRFDLSTEEGREQALQYIEEIVSHEVGHNMGIEGGDEHTDKGRERKPDEVMYKGRGLSSDIYRKRWSSNDITTVSDRWIMTQ